MTFKIVYADGGIKVVNSTKLSFWDKLERELKYRDVSEIWIKQYDEYMDITNIFKYLGGNR